LTTKCLYCDTKFKVNTRGRKRKYHSDACRVAAFRSKKDYETKYQTERISLQHCDLLNLKIDEKVDLILTDPPYPKEFLPVWGKLGQLAHRILKPGHLLVTYSGAAWLPYVMAQLGEYLDYVWTGSVTTEFGRGWGNSFFPYKIRSKTKQILVYSNGKYKPEKGQWFRDAFIIDHKIQNKKHKWQQASEPFEYYIRKLTKENDLICDPFLGAGTTAIVCKEMNRRFVGCDVDKSALKIVEERLEFVS
jgi:DNA modification methylase